LEGSFGLGITAVQQFEGALCPAAGFGIAAAGIVCGAHGQVQRFGPDDVAFTALRRWRSERSGVNYPVSWRLRVGARELQIEPLLDDQENDARLSSGALYWEGAVGVRENSRSVGSGYLELTGYDHPLSLR